MAGDNYLERRVASRRNVTRRLVVVWSSFPVLSLKAAGMWACERRLRRWSTPRSGALSTVAAGAPQARRPRVHGLPGANRPAPSASRKLIDCVQTSAGTASVLRRPPRTISVTHAAPSLHPALQRPQLRLTVVNLWSHRDQASHQGLGRYRGLRDQPPFNDWPRVGEWGDPSPSSVWPGAACDASGVLHLLSRLTTSLKERCNIGCTSRLHFSGMRWAAISLNVCCALRISCRQKPLKAARDRALLLIGFAGALRRSELVAI